MSNVSKEREMSGPWTHEFGFPISASPNRVFAALTDPAELEQWFAEHVRVDARPDGSYRFWGRHTLCTPEERDAEPGRITAWSPDARVGFEWTVCGVPSVVTITLSPKDAGQDPVTDLTIRHDLQGMPDRPRPKALIDDWWRFTVGNLATHVTGQGQVLRPDFADPEPEIRLSLTIDAPREAVFAALTDPDALREWMGATAPVVEPRAGGRYELGWTYEVDGRPVSGGPMRIIEIVPDERLVVDWPDWRGDGSVPMQTITWLLEPEGTDRTKVTLVHAGFTRTVDFSDYPFGWGHFMSEMAKVAVRIGVSG
jgi:uncharacterized protein YndB with AHSA1/START domain